PIAVEVVGADDQPAESVRRVQARVEADAGSMCSSVHVPDLKLAGAALVPEDVRLAVLVEVVGSHDLPPGVVWDSVEIRGREPGPPTHEPDLTLSAVPVPEDVGVTILVEVVGADDLPPAEIWHVE